MVKYKEIYPQSLSNGVGVISALSVLPVIPWNTLSAAEKQGLERAYNIRSGCKTLLSTFVEMDELSRVNVLAAMFSQKWTKLWNDFTLEYDPLHAYVLEENGNRSHTVSDTHTNTYGKEVSENGSNTGTIQNSGSENLNGNAGIYGFNSVVAVPSDTQTEVTTNEDTETRNLSNSRTIINSGTDTKKVAGTDSEQHSLTKKGNIGYTTPQELLLKDIELWATAFFGIVFADIDSFITIHVFDI